MQVLVNLPEVLEGERLLVSVEGDLGLGPGTCWEVGRLPNL